MSESKLWERRENETDKAFAAFSIYLGLGSERSIEKAWKQHNPDGNGVPGHFSKWAAKNEWVKRSAAYDAWVFDEEQEMLRTARLDSKEAIVQAEFDDYHALRDAWLELAKVTHPVTRTVETREGRTVEVLKTDSYGFQALVAARKRISEGLRLAAEMPSKYERSEITGADGGPIKTDDGLSDAERAARVMAFVNAATKAGGGGDSGG